MNRLRAEILGYPVSHSLSPTIYSFLASQKGLSDFEYGLREIRPEVLEETLQLERIKKDLLGFNVTIPHKEGILKYLDSLSTESNLIGAVNVVHKVGENLLGYNTDVRGIEATLLRNEVDVQGSSVFIFGAGGGARAVGYVMGQKKAKSVYLFNQDTERAVRLAAQYQEAFPETHFYGVHSVSETVLRDEVNLIVNATPLGMQGKEVSKNGLPAEEFFFTLMSQLKFSNRAAAFDLIYNPENTKFLKVSKDLGLRTMGGLEMLVEQALETWKIWFKDLICDSDRDSLLDFLRFRPIFLTGFMGAGKSTVGPILADLLGWKFLDMDHLIEKKVGMTVSEFFKRNGESRFRELESQSIARSAFQSRTVIALGGGALTIESNRKMIRKAGRLIFLSTRPETLLKRLKNEIRKRPLLESLLGANPEEQLIEVKRLLEDREKVYSTAEIKINTDKLSPREIGYRIVEVL